jgi:hypothetical protein
MADHSERRMTRLIASLDARLLEAMTLREDLSDEALAEIAMIETARNAVLRVMSETVFSDGNLRRIS